MEKLEGQSLPEMREKDEQAEQQGFWDGVTILGDTAKVDTCHRGFVKNPENAQYPQ